MREPPYYINYSKPRLSIHNIITSKYFDLAIAAVIGLNVVTMAMEFYMMPYKLEYTLKMFNYFFTAVFIFEACMKIFALGFMRYLKNRWNQLDIMIVGLSIAGIILEKMESDFIPINPTIMRVMRVLRIARVLKLLKMAKGIRALLDTVMQALPQVGNLGLLFFLLFFIFAALGVELFGRLECTEDLPCEGLGEHAHFKDFGMAFLTLFRVATGDNWNGIMKDTLRDNCDYSSDCIQNCCISPIIAPLYFVIFVLMAQFVLVNVVVAVLMKHLEESHKHMDDDMEMDAELERELAAEVQQKKLAELGVQVKQVMQVCQQKNHHKPPKSRSVRHKPLVKMASLPSNFIFPFNSGDNTGIHLNPLSVHNARNTTDCIFETQRHLSLSPDSVCEQTPETLALTPNINLRQATPDEAESKVSVANLSPLPLRTSFSCASNITNSGNPKLSISAANSDVDIENSAHHLSPLCAGMQRVEELNGKTVETTDFPRNSELGEWNCIFASSNSEPFKVQHLPAVNDEKLSEFLCEDSLLKFPNVNDLQGAQPDRKTSNSLHYTLPNNSVIRRYPECDSVSLTNLVDMSSSPTKDDHVLQSGKACRRGGSNVSHSSLYLFDADCDHMDNTPLILKRLKKKLLSQGGESSLSSQSDIPDDVRDKSFTTDSTSLEC